MKTKIFTLLFIASSFLYGCSKDENATNSDSETTSNAIKGVWMVLYSRHTAFYKFGLQMARVF